MSYNQMAIEVKSSHGVDISGQGIDQRFNERAQKYIQGMIGEQLSSQVSQSIATGWSKHFNRIIIKDSTKFDLFKTLSEKLPGFGGWVYITEGMLDVEAIVKIYRIRWQIELIFYGNLSSG